jgi:maleylpyruvate isomerase
VNVDRPGAEISGVRASHATLAEWVSRITDAQVGEPSLLPGWTRGHLLTHIARNADSVVRRLEGARRGEIADQYVGGAEGRAQEIEDGARRTAAELAEDVRSSAAAVDAAFADFPDGAWDRLGRGVSGHEAPMVELPLQRWREIEIHLLDLAIGYSPADWPDAFVDAALPQILKSLPKRSDKHALLSWALNRTSEAPDLGPWG